MLVVPEITFNDPAISNFQSMFRAGCQDFFFFFFFFLFLQVAAPCLSWTMTNNEKCDALALTLTVFLLLLGMLHIGVSALAAAQCN